jgi:hypothetical protein
VEADLRVVLERLDAIQKLQRDMGNRLGMQDARAGDLRFG